MIRAWTFVLLLAAQDQKAPVPDAAAQKEAEKTIREVFKDQYGLTTLADRQALARELLQQAQSPDNPPSVRYVLLRDAQGLGDLETSSKAAEQMSRFFAVNVFALRLKTLNLSIPKAPEEFKPLAEQYLSLADEALQAGDAEVADKAAQAGLANARRAKDIPLLTRAQTKAKELGELRVRLDAVKKAEETLARDPNHSGSNGAVGYYECVLRGNWERGLPLLAKGDQPALKAAALLDQSAPEEAPRQIEVGDAWWTASDAEGGIGKQSLRQRALYWYGKALPRSTGLTKLKLEARFNETGRKAAELAGDQGPFDLAERGHIRHWLLVGPFPGVADKGLETDYLNGEATVVPKDGREVETQGLKLKWGMYASPGEVIDFTKVPHLGVRNGQANIMNYAACWVHVDAEQDLEVRMGSDDGSFLWVDGKLIGKNHVHQALIPDCFVHPVRLSRGRHLILVKVENWQGATSFCLRVTTPKGDRPVGIQVWN